MYQYGVIEICLSGNIIQNTSSCLSLGSIFNQIKVLRHSVSTPWLVVRIDVNIKQISYYHSCSVVVVVVVVVVVNNNNNNNNTVQIRNNLFKCLT